MKYVRFVLIALLLSSFAAAEEVTLPTPHKTGGMPLMEALAKRCTTRAFDRRELSPQQLSDLLWAGFGINRPDGKRTAPSTRNKQELELFVLLKSGSYIYDAAKNCLHPVASEDLRSSLGANIDAPVCLLFVADLSRQGETGDGRKNIAAVDSGFISENIYLYCASEGLATGYRSGFDRSALTTKLKLAPDQEIVAVQRVGYPKS